MLPQQLQSPLDGDFSYGQAISCNLGIIRLTAMTTRAKRAQLTSRPSLQDLLQYNLPTLTTRNLK
jgi:hypothetical protein